MVDAQLATWGKSIARKHFIFVGGDHDDGLWGLSTGLTCGDTMEDLACKEAVLIDRAADRIQGTQAEWFVVTEDDHFVFPDSYANLLSNYDPDAPQALTFAWGCGRRWEHHPESRNGTLPMPDNFVQPTYTCDAVARKGGICSGGSYILSRGALKMIKEHKHLNQHSGSFVDQFLSSIDRGGFGRRHTDVAASCFFYEQGIPQVLVKKAAREGAVQFQGNTEAEQDAEIDMLVRPFNDMKPLSIHFTHEKKRNIPDYMTRVANVLRSAESMIAFIRRRQSEELKPENLARMTDELKEKDSSVLDMKQRDAYDRFDNMRRQKYPDDVVDKQRQIWDFFKKLADEKTIANIRRKQSEELKPENLARMTDELKDKDSGFLDKKQRRAYQYFNDMRRQKYPDDVVDNQRKILDFFKKLADDKMIADIRRRQSEKLKPENLARTTDELKDKDFGFLDEKQRRAYKHFDNMRRHKYPDDVVENQKKIWGFFKKLAGGSLANAKTIADISRKQSEELKPQNLARTTDELEDEDSCSDIQGEGT
eukprot:gnl/TRDRNA2_/TRDRNA2_174576_c0_seq5.p1 gnl/TRDRNA2_/TRDRNA2_174576_c0~~gnl/TRDRNA2_/TRDRNA2_174576_c0_seq5.p1  ORF type:complete len:546 (+),score=99.28 gnl/TRDRNA2_/TRDRNA2_174576_c0_seq5:33-1640(+)